LFLTDTSLGRRPDFRAHSWRGEWRFDRTTFRDAFNDPAKTTYFDVAGDIENAAGVQNRDALGGRQLRHGAGAFARTGPSDGLRSPTDPSHEASPGLPKGSIPAARPVSETAVAKPCRSQCGGKLVLTNLPDEDFWRAGGRQAPLSLRPTSRCRRNPPG